MVVAVRLARGVMEYGTASSNRLQRLIRHLRNQGVLLPKVEYRLDVTKRDISIETLIKMFAEIYRIPHPLGR